MATTSSSLAVCATTSSSPTFCATSSSSPFVFIPTPGHVMTVRWIPSFQEENNGSQHLSQSSTPKNLIPGLTVDHEVLNCVGNPHPHNRNALGSYIPSCQLLILDVALLPFASTCSRQDESEYRKK
ncbi:hypothetical protein V6N12_017803 [Hibiscus sabdariffa]|uniref:Uncharacterized protein n=1 Tax=Hibiscus sabdariffa TaxID=183260 RepID=A0ABR2BBV9_9ROSI